MKAEAKATATPTTTKRPTALARATSTPAKPAAPKFAPGQCHYTGGWGDESTGFRKLVVADVTCKFPAAKGKTHCGSADGAPNHEAMYVAAAKLRASARRAEADRQAGITKPQPSAAAVAKDAKPKAAFKPPTSEERIARNGRRSNPAAPRREPAARFTRQANGDGQR